MIYILKGHDLRHAVEEMILHLLPTVITEQAETEPEQGNYCVSELEINGQTAKATTTVKIYDKIEQKSREATLPNTDELANKRVLTEIIKLSIYDAILLFLDKAPEWGSLTGVRPAKLARGLMERGLTRPEAAVQFREKFGVSAERTALTMRAAAHAQSAIDILPENSVSLYIGIPFCPSRCAYCSFVSQSIQKSAGLIPPYVDSICEEIKRTGEIVAKTNRVLSTVYMGGGTPTTLSPEQLEKIMTCVKNSFDMSNLIEYTVEAGRPDTITTEKMQAIKLGGADRVSINPQTMNDEVLKNIGRHHSADDVIKAYEIARKTGFSVINMDTIAGLLGDTPESFENTINTLINLNPENITVHTLAIKRGADLYDKEANANQHNSVKKMLDTASNLLSNAGYGPYYLYRQKFTAGGFENVGWCKPQTESIYNIAMMEEIQSILSVGAGAVSKLVDLKTGKITRFVNPKYPKEYMESGERIILGKQKLFHIF